MKLKDCLKPQTVLTVQKENAFFAASVNTAVILHCIFNPSDCTGFFTLVPNLSADVLFK